MAAKFATLLSILMLPAAGLFANPSATLAERLPNATNLSTPRPGVQLLAQRGRRPLSWRVGVRSSRYRMGGLSRSGTCSIPAKIVPFAPPALTEERVGMFKTPVDLTLSSRPTFWVYVSGIPKNTPLQFTLQDARGDKELYSTQFTPSQESGLIGVRLPQTAPELTVGESYYWAMSMQCPDDPSTINLIAATGWVQRVNPKQMPATSTFDPKPLIRDLNKASDLDKPALYAGLGIWQDAVTSLIDLQQKLPNNQTLKQDWRELLTGAQMNQYINAPILAIY
jgi:hypothetical protein